MRRFLFKGLGILILLGAGMMAFAAWWIDQAMPLSADSVEVRIESGATARHVAQTIVRSGVTVNPTLLWSWFRLSGEARRIKPGTYTLDASVTPRALLQKLLRGEELLASITLVEGWNFRQMLQALSKEEHLKHDAQGLSDDAIMQKLGKSGLHPEGRFFPDTYSVAQGSSELQLLERAMNAMNQRLTAAWAQRAADTPLKSPEQALILASIVEKETGRASDRPLVASVFANRLRMGMLLQTDPTVIYGLGAKFDGNLRKKDLLTDTPWNTYTRAGLPPTPIAMPGKDSLLAAVAPPASKALYFVARGDGTSQFSATLAEHNRAVNQYQRK